jgi:fimbrial isopeptide formation D2 family protein/LPXTG-motif cell wall-anchored protein
MKQLKKLTAALMTIALALGMSLTLDAAENDYSITINESAEGHTFVAYQILTGTIINEDGKYILSDAKVGSSIKDTSINLDALIEAASDVNDSALATKEFAAKYVDLNAPVAQSVYNASAKNYTISNLPSGLYLIEDAVSAVSAVSDDEENEIVYSQYMIDVAHNITISPKTGTTEVMKKVKDVNDSQENSTSDWQDSADYDIGDEVPFRLQALLAENVSSYDTYKIVFHDTLSSGLTYNDNAIITVNDTDVTDKFDISYANNELTISCSNVKGFASNTDEIIVDYTATLNGNAVLGSKGNPNKVYLEYSNNPNNGQEGKTDTTSKTPEDKVIVFTYKVDINKVRPASDGEKADENGNVPLVGAEFKLEKKLANGDWQELALVKAESGTNFYFEGLDDGDYRLSETTTPDGYNSIDPVEFTVTAEHDIDSDDPALTSLSGNSADGSVTELKFTAKPAYEEDGTTVASENAGLSTDVLNQKGTVLPRTGGMGTKLIYAAGIILVLGAGILLITRIRMKEAQ